MRYSKWVLAGICAAFSLTAMISTAGPAARASALALTGPVARAEPQRCLPPLPDVLLEPGMVSQADEAWATRYAPGSLVVKFGPKLGEAVRQQLESDAGELNRALTPRIQELHRELGVAEVIPLFPLAAKLPDPADYPRYQAGNGPLPRIEHIFQVTFTAAVDAAAAAARYAALAGVEYAEPDWIVRAAYAPNDEFYNVNQLWGLFNISAAAAWDVATGAGVTVAVIDTGIYAGHPELAGRIYTNPGEIAGNGVDDDGNGRVDDVHGWDFVANDNNPADGHGHGTHVSGTIAGTADNLYGVAGLAFAAEILPIKGLNDYGSGQTTQLEAALLYAAAMNPDVINNSWGGSGHIQAFQDAIDYAVGLGITVICAAGNNNLDVMDFSPANVETAIAVSAVDRTDTKATYSNFGVKIDVAGPGGFNTTPPGAANPGADVLSTVPPSCYLQTGFGYPVTLGGDGAPYMPISGTSMAAPHVSALAALILELHPGWTPEQVRQVIRQSADDIDAIGFDVNTGYGRIDAAAAVSAFTTPPPVASILTPYNGEVVSGSVTVTGSATATGFVNYVIQLGAGATPTSFTTIYTGASPVTNGTLATGVSTNYADGLYTLRLVTTGPGGVTSEDRNLITIDNFYISSPGPQELFPVNTSSSVTVVGQVPTGSAPGSPQLLGYTLKYAPGENPGSGSFVTIANGTLPVYPEGNIALWDLTSVPDGKVTLRLEGTYTTGTVTHDVLVLVDQYLRSGWPVTAENPNSYTFKSPQVADLDRDGRQEIILGSAVFQDDGSVRPGWTDNPGLGRTNPVIIDTDSDGRLEVVHADFTQWYSSPQFPSEPNYGAPVIRAYNAGGTLDPGGWQDWEYMVQNPATGPEYNSGMISSLAAGDVNGDGALEVVFTIWFNYSNSAHNTTVFVLDAATGTLLAREIIAGTSISTPGIFDLNGDGTDEIIVSCWVNSGDDWLHVLDGDALPVTWGNWPASFDDEGSGVSEPIAGDVDLDGDLEVMLGKQLFHGDGTPVTGWPVAFIGRSTGAVFPSADGDPQLELCRGAGNMVLFSMHDDDGTLKFLKFPSGENLYVIMAGENGRQGNPIVADIDGDGIEEIIRSHEMGWVDGRPAVFYGSESTNATDPANFPRYVIEPAYIVRSTSTVADIDCNGLTDVLVAAGGKIYAWEFGTSYDPSANPWAMFQHDYRHTGNLHTVLCAPPPAGMKAWWPFDETLGTIAHDRFGSAHGAHTNGPVPTPGYVEGGLQFDGINDYVQVPNSAAVNVGTGDFSIDCWVRTTDETDDCPIVDKRATANTLGYCFYLLRGVPSCILANATSRGDFVPLPTASVGDGQWHFIALTVDRDDMYGGKIYVDGAEVLTFNPMQQQGNLTNTSPLRIGAYSYTLNGNFFPGTLDEVELFNRALTACDIQALYMAGREGKCVISTPVPFAVPAAGPAGVVGLVLALSLLLARQAMTRKQ